MKTTFTTKALVCLFVLLSINGFAQTPDQRAELIQNGTQNNYMSADQSFYYHNNNRNNDPYGYGYWVTAHTLETLADAYQRTRNVVYKNRMKSIIAGIRKYNLYATGTYRNDYYDDLEWLCLAAFNCYNATRDPEFLDAVHQIWAEIKTGYSNGRMSWKKGCTTPCNNAIGNSPAIIIAVKLYKLEGDPANLQMAKDIHAFVKSTMLNANGGIWDSPDNHNPDWQFSYNSGMFIGACLELAIVTGQQSYIDDGIKACEFMVNFRNYQGGVFFLNETGQGDGGLFKGIFAKWFTEFVRVGNLTTAQRERYIRFINYTGNYAWINSVNKSNYLIAPNWSNMPSGTIDLSTQTSGLHLFESVASLNKVHVYADINYAGFYSQLPVGSYTLAQLQAKGVNDNDITSLTIPIGYSVTVYENDNFSGASKTFTANTGWLADWNDKISSIKIANLNGPVSVYQDITFGGYAAGLEVGDYTLAQLKAMGINDNDITSLKIAQGYKVTMYDGDNFTGTSVDYTADNGWIADWNDKATSIRVRANGDPSIAGTYALQNRNSSLYADIWGAGTNDGVAIAQGAYNGNNNQLFKFVHLGDGTYQIVALHSNKSLDVDAIGKENGTKIQQWTYNGTANQQFIVIATGDGYYKFIAKHSGKLIDVSESSTNSGVVLRQQQNSNQTSAMWKLYVPTGVNGNGDGLTGSYYNGMNFETPVLSRKDANLNMNWGNGSPAAGVNADQFTVRWTGQIQPRYSGEYTFIINSDNGRRVWINNQLVIDKWVDDWNVDYTGTITLTAQQKYDIKVEYFENNGGAGVKLEWSSVQQAREVVPTSQLYSNPAPTVSVSSNVTSATAPASFTFTATTADANGIAKVDFYNGTTLLGSDNASPYTYTWTNVPIGSYAITAIATDSKGAITVSSAITVQSTAVVNKVPMVNITSPVNNASFNAPANITVNANASDSDGNITKVEFYNGSNKLGEDATSPYSHNWNNVAAGTYSITTKAYDNSGAVTTSTAVSVTVKTVSTDLCSQFNSYVENGGYVAGSKVKNNGRQYECKEWPYSGWCNGGAWAYAPGSGAYWQDAWYDRGACSAARIAQNDEASEIVMVSPNPATDIIYLQSDVQATVTVYNMQGMQVTTPIAIDAEGKMDISALPAGSYMVKFDTSYEIITQLLLKR